jgi:hypothetical protein
VIPLHSALFDPDRKHRNLTAASILGAAVTEEEVRNFTRWAIMPLVPMSDPTLLDRLAGTGLDPWIMDAVRAEISAAGEATGDPQNAATVERLARGYWRSPHVRASLALPARPPRSARMRQNAGRDAVVDFLGSRPGDSAALFAALVAAAPAHERAQPLLGTDLFETLYSDIGSRAMGFLREAGCVRRS